PTGDRQAASVVRVERLFGHKAPAGPRHARLRFHLFTNLLELAAERKTKPHPYQENFVFFVGVICQMRAVKGELQHPTRLCQRGGVKSIAGPISPRQVLFSYGQALPRNWMIFRRSRLEGRPAGSSSNCFIAFRSAATFRRNSRAASVSR